MIDSPAILDLGDVTVTTEGTTTETAIENLEGLEGASLQVYFIYGSGGTTCKVYVQTSLDQGTTWVDVACFAFTTATARKAANLSSTTVGVSTATDGTLADNTVLNGVLGDRLRAKVVSTGTYADNTLVSIRAATR